MKIGARIIKTGVTLVLAIYLSQIFQLEPVIYAAIAATLAIQPSLFRSWQYVIEQVQSNLVGATVAIIFSTYIGTNPILIAIAIMLVIGINLQLHFERSIALSIVTVLSIMEGNIESHYLIFGAERFLLIFIGLISAITVNMLLFPPKYDKRLVKKMKNVEEQMASIFRILLDENRNERTIRLTLKNLEEEIEQIWSLFHFEEEAKRYLKRKLAFSSSRKLVILKSMLETAQSGIKMFRMIEKYHYSIQRLPESTKSLLHEQLIVLANYQDKIYSKYEGKILASPHHMPNQSLVNSQWIIYDQITALNNDNELILDIVTIISMIREYNKQLDHLDRLVDSYHTHHTSEKTQP